jgi:predicted nuclease with RNAse H fold
MPAQSLQGNEQPFDRLVRFLASGGFEVAAIDAPFALPLAHMPGGRHSELLRKVRLLPNAPDRPFPRGADIVALGEAVAPRTEAKPLRLTERYWVSRGVNVRSTMWCGARGGAPFTAACLRLIERSGRPLWPWALTQSGRLAEAFPAAQLRQWGLPDRGYARLSAVRARAAIIDSLRERIDLTSTQVETALNCSDALDAIIAVFAAIAISYRSVPGFTSANEEGFISVAS